MPPSASPLPPRHRRRWLLALALLLGAAGWLPAASPRWVKVEAPEFTVITSLREKEAVAWAGEFSQFIAAMRGFARIDTERLPRLTVVIFARHADFKAHRPRRDDGTVMDIAGFFSRRPSWAVAGFAGTMLDAETRPIFFHEGTHWLLSGAELPNPSWLEEGLAEVFSTFTVDGKYAKWGEPIAAHVLQLRTEGLMPLEKFLYHATGDLHSEQSAATLSTERAYAQSWGFVHYLMFGQHDLPKNVLHEYVSTLRTLHPDEAFKQAFHGSYAEIDRKLLLYLRSGRYLVTRQLLAPLPPAKAQAATELEVEDALARLCLVGGRRDEAAAHMKRALAVGGDHPRAYVLQGEVAQETDDAAGARAAYLKAIELGSQDFRPYYEIAAAEHHDAGQADGSLRQLEPSAARTIANRYERAINLNPRFRPAYEGLAGLLELVPPGNTEDAKFLELGQRLYPESGMIRIGLAILARRSGDDRRARQLLADVQISTTATTDELAYARLLEQNWTQNDAFARIDELAKNKKYPEALALIDEQLKVATDFGLRQQLSAHRGQLLAVQLLEEARVAIEERRWADARAKYRAILDSDAPPMLKTQVRRSLESLEGAPKRKKL